MGTPVTTTLVRRIAAALGIDRPSEWSLAYALASAQLPVGWTALIQEDGHVTFVHDTRPQEPQADHPLLNTAAQVLAQVRARPELDAARGRFLGPFENLDSPALEYVYLDTETGQEAPEYDCPPDQVIPQASEDIRQLLAAAVAASAADPADELGQQGQQPLQEAEDGASYDPGVPAEPASRGRLGEDPGPRSAPLSRDPSRGSFGAPASPGGAHTASPGLSGSRPGSARPGSARPDSASASARPTSARPSSRPGSSTGPSPRPGSAARPDPYDPSSPKTPATTAAAAAGNATPRSASGSRPSSGREAAAGGAAAPVAAAARSSSGTGEGRLLASASSIVAEASRASVAASDVTSASAAAAAAERRRSSSAAASVPAAPAAASGSGRAGSAGNGHDGAVSGGAGGSRVGSAVGSSTKGAGEGAGGVRGASGEPGRPSSGASGRSGASGSQRSRAASSARSGGDGSGGGGSPSGSVRCGAGGDGSGGGGSLRSDSGVSRGPVPPPSGRLTFYGWWFEDVESSDLTFRIDSKPQAGGGLAPRHCTLVYDFNTASYSLTMRDPVTPPAPGQPADRVPALTVPGISPDRVTRTDTGQPADVWDLHLGARLLILERPVVLKNSDLATAQWHAGYFRQLAALREKLCQEVQKYKPRVLRPGLVHDKGDVRLQTGQQLRHVALQVRELIEDLRQYRPAKAESFMAALPVYL